MKIKNCRNCNSNFLKKLFSLGNLSFTGKFPNKINGLVETLIKEKVESVKKIPPKNILPVVKN